MERRRSSRIPFNAPAVITTKNAPRISSQVQNISDSGLFVASSRNSTEGENVLVSIQLQEGDSCLTITLPCTVARVADNGIGCTSDHIDVEMLLFSSNLLSPATRQGSEQIMNRFLEFVREHEFPHHHEFQPGSSDRTRQV